MLAPQQYAPTLRGYVLLGLYGRHPHSGMKGLAALTPQEALSQTVSASGVTWGNLSTSALLLQAVQQGQILDSNGQPAYIPGTADCAASGVSSGARDLALAGSGGSMVLTTLSAPSIGLIAAGPATLGISIAIAGIVGIFTTIMNHHAQAVKKEQSVLCSAVPAANNYLKIIVSAVPNGQATPAQAIAALQSLSSDFDSAVSSIRKMSGGSCNAACVMTEELRAIIAYLTSQYQDMIAGSAAATSPLTPSPVTSTGPSSAPAISSGSVMVLPSASTPTPAAGAAAASAAQQAAASSSIFSGTNWLPIAAIAVVGILLFRGL
jgi:hypothetical protein